MRPLKQGWPLIQFELCPYKKRKLLHTERHQGCTGTEEETARQPPANQAERPQRKPNPLTP